jgi:hypothetical protein
MEMVLGAADHEKGRTLASGAAVQGGAGPSGPTTTDSEEPPSWGTWATDGKCVISYILKHIV